MKLFSYLYEFSIQPKGGSNGTQTLSYLVHKSTLNHLPNMVCGNCV